jgi:predicted deacetylase
MKINEVITEAGFFKGVARAIAPQTVQTYDRQKNALRAPAVDQDAIRKFAKYNKFVDILASRAKAGQAQSLQTIGQQLPKKGETANPDVRRQVLIYVAQQLQSRGIQVQGFSAPTLQPITVGNEIIQPSDPRYAKIMQTIK